MLDTVATVLERRQQKISSIDSRQLKRILEQISTFIPPKSPVISPE